LPVVTGWYYAVLLGAAPWLMFAKPGWVPAVVALVLLVRHRAIRSRGGEPWTSLGIAASCVVALAVGGGWQPAVGWLAAALVVAGIARSQAGRSTTARPDRADIAALVTWGAAFGLRPELLGLDRGGWLAPALLLAVARQAEWLGLSARRPSTVPGPPSREVRGTLSMRGVILEGRPGPRSVPLDLELRAGDTAAILCDVAADATALAEVLAGRVVPRQGSVSIDAHPLREEDRIIAVVAAGEAFVDGSLETNLAVLCDEDPSEDTLAAVHETCHLSELVEALGEADIGRDGEPLSTIHRLMLLAARVVPSSYRVLVAVDPMPWVNAIRGELWRNVVVRASVGRTAVWITADRELAARASLIMELRHGALRPCRGDRTRGGNNG
jgi:predicted ABC-type transport system involved in lysophospholipase L1 biosynthesis ATPase subunit